jgi:hypothetical protein
VLQDTQTQWPPLADQEPLLRCTFLDCPEQQVFPTKSALKYLAFEHLMITSCLQRRRKHEDRHNRPYICNHTSCKRQTFGDKGSLERHKREVHGSEAYTCPVSSCPRHKTGFARKYNLVDHQRRRHSRQSSKMLQSYANSPNHPSEGVEISRRFLCEDSIEGMDEDDVDASDVVRDLTANSEQSLRAKLRDLRALRGKLDLAIISWKRL